MPSRPNFPKILHPLHWIRAIAALLVVMDHTEITLARAKYLGTGTYPTLRNGAFGVQLFFVLSGFVIYYAHRADPERDASALRTYAIKRGRRVFPTLWAVLLPVALLSFLGVSSERPSLFDLVMSVLSLPVPDEVLLSVQWTLRHELLFYGVFALFLWRRSVGLACLLLWAVVGSALSFMIEAHWLIEFLLNPNHLLFVLGMGVGALYVRGRMQLAAPALALGALLFGLCWVTEPKSHENGWGVIGFGVASTLLLYGLVGLRRINVENSLMTSLSDASYALYLVNFPLVSALCKLVMRVDAKLHLDQRVYFWVIVLLCQLLAIAFHLVVERPLLRAVTRWTNPRLADGRTASGAVRRAETT